MFILHNEYWEKSENFVDFIKIRCYYKVINRKKSENFKKSDGIILIYIIFTNLKYWGELKWKKTESSGAQR